MISKRMMLLGSILVAGAGSAVSFASSTQASSSISVSASTSSVATVASASQGNGPYSGTTLTQPSMSPAALTTGSVGAGDLYSVTPSTSGDMLVTLYLSNAGQLANDYGYLNFTVQVDYGTGNSWSSALDTSGTTASGVLSLTNGYLTFDLPATQTGWAAGDKYAISVTGGDYYCTSTTASNGNLGPNFYVTVQPSAT